MKNCIKRLSVLLFLLYSFSFFAKTTVCEIIFYTNSIKYDCLMVLHDTNSYGNNYMRVAYTINGNHIIINQQLILDKQLLPDGNTYVTASGYNVKFISSNPGITYNADKISVLINANGVIDQPKIGDSRNAMMPVSSYKDLSNETLDLAYLRRFFTDGEPELYTLSLNSFGNYQSSQTPQTSQAVNYNSNQNSVQIEFYNNTGSEISACYAYYNNEDKCWTSVGWYTIPAYSYKTIDIGNYTGSIYLRGRQGLATEWGSGDGQFCVDATQAFNIKFADTKDCWSKKKFTKYNVKPGINKWTFN
jgi:hypothetical protein